MCGIIGVYAPGREVAKIIYFSLYALQHRGQESTGIAVSNPVGIFLYKNLGLISQVFNETIFKQAFPLEITCGIGHNRYSTTGSNSYPNSQPMVIRSQKRLTPKEERIKIALAHNGNIVNADELRKKLEKEGVKFYSTSDSEILINLIAQSYGKNFQGDIINMMQMAKGAYSIVMLAYNKLWAIRDPFGIRPLVLGHLFDEDQWVIASETCALDTVGANFIKEILPGSIVMIDETGYHEIQAIKNCPSKFCIFEFIYFARPDSFLMGKRVELVRRNFGKMLALESPVEADLVINVPDSSTPHAKGFAEKINIGYEEIFIKNRYIFRTFINPDQTLRDFGVYLKLNPLKELLRRKRIVVVEDSIVRGTTTKQIVNLLKKLGAKEVHVRVASPPYRYPCFYGIDTAAADQLIAHNHSIEEIRQQIGADSLAYLSIEGMIRAIGLSKENFCLACFEGNYPIEIPDVTLAQKHVFEK